MGGWGKFEAMLLLKINRNSGDASTDSNFQNIMSIAHLSPSRFLCLCTTNPVLLTTAGHTIPYPRFSCSHGIDLFQKENTGVMTTMKSSRTLPGCLSLL